MSIVVRELILKDDFESYEILNVVGVGGWGKVYKAKRKSDKKIVGLKFFGYTLKTPLINEINHEVMLMMSLIGVDGIIIIIIIIFIIIILSFYLPLHF